MKMHAKWENFPDTESHIRKTRATHTKGARQKHMKSKRCMPVFRPDYFDYSLDDLPMVLSSSSPINLTGTLDVNAWLIL